MSTEELDATRVALTGSQGDALRELMFHLALGRPAQGPTELAASLGWLDNGALSAFGRLVADPLREYSFWLERERRWPSETRVPVLRRARYAHKALLEAGSGGGCNLLSLAGFPGDFVGLEPMPVYVQMMPILAQMAGVQCPTAIEGAAEAMPFQDRRFDVVLCYSSHQYMDLHTALAEMVRVLKPGGTLIVVGNSLTPFAFESAGRFASTRSLGTLRYDGKALINTLAYQALGRRVLAGGSGTTTGTPIYPSLRFMRGRLQELGMTIAHHLCASLPSGETVLVAVR